MSINKCILEIIPPPFQQLRERFSLGGFCCPVCNGQGKYQEQTGFEQYHTEVCDYCEGTGQVKADVKIEWRSHK